MKHLFRYKVNIYDNMQCMRTLERPFKSNCEECGSDLSDSEDWGVYYDDEDFDELD